MVVRRYGTLERSRTDILRRSDMPESMWCRDRFWAPELFFFDGWFYLTFNCRNESEEYRHSHSVGLARSKNVTGPYEVLTKEHGLTEGVPGYNDASLYAENGIFYLLCNEKHGIHMYKLDPETVTLSAGRKLCGCGADGEWDSIGVEGPCLVKRCGKYFLFYSSWTNGYNAGYCIADSLEGGFKKISG